MRTRFIFWFFFLTSSGIYKSLATTTPNDLLYLEELGSGDDALDDSEISSKLPVVTPSDRTYHHHPPPTPVPGPPTTSSVAPGNPAVLKHADYADEGSGTDTSAGNKDDFYPYFDDDDYDANYEEETEGSGHLPIDTGTLIETHHLPPNYDHIPFTDTDSRSGGAEEEFFIPSENVPEQEDIPTTRMPSTTTPTAMNERENIRILTQTEDDIKVSIFAQPGILAENPDAPLNSTEIEYPISDTNETLFENTFVNDTQIENIDVVYNGSLLASSRLYKYLAFIGGAVMGLLCAILLVMFIVYRMRKRDEGSYPLDEPKRVPLTSSYSPNDKEIYA